MTWSCVQGLPLGSGLGSSAASAAASAGAVNALFGDALSRQELVLPGLCSEAAVSGYHADNIAPAILGGFVLIRCADYSHHTTGLCRITFKMWPSIGHGREAYTDFCDCLSWL